jgi:hypothetical protein
MAIFVLLLLLLCKRERHCYFGGYLCYEGILLPSLHIHSKSHSLSFVLARCLGRAKKSAQVCDIFMFLRSTFLSCEPSQEYGSPSVRDCVLNTFTGVLHVLRPHVMCRCKLSVILMLICTWLAICLEESCFFFGLFPSCNVSKIPVPYGAMVLEEPWPPSRQISIRLFSEPFLSSQ